MKPDECAHCPMCLVLRADKLSGDEVRRAHAKRWTAGACNRCGHHSCQMALASPGAAA